MLERADLLCTAWAGDLLVGVARSVTDFSYCCYLSDLAVHISFQKRGIGVELLRLTQSLLHPKCTMILLAAPKAEGYYPKIGMVRHHSAWTKLASPLLATKNTCIAQTGDRSKKAHKQRAQTGKSSKIMGGA